MRRIRFDHIAIAVPRLADAPAFLVGELGGTPAHGGIARAYRFGQWRFKDGGRLEMLEPRGADGFLHRFLAQRGPGIHHVTFLVPSLREACDRAGGHGYTVVGYDDSDARWQEAFLHPKQALGIVVAPPGPPNPPPPVGVLGLRMVARSRERAETQWGRVLGGEASEGAAGVVTYRWPGSPMRIVVEVDPARDEGPLLIELATERGIALPERPHPVLGAVFYEPPASASQ